jgi:GDP-mannose 6-dehydrogenase
VGQVHENHDLWMGYAGCVTAACLADHGHDVTGVDVDEKKVEMINHSQGPIIEPGLTDIIKRGVKAGKLRAKTDTAKLGAVSLICVATAALNCLRKTQVG